MKKVAYTAKSGSRQWKPVFNKTFERVAMEGNTGFCLACGCDQTGVEPDARRYTCENCSAEKVYGLEELVMMGLVR